MKQAVAYLQDHAKLTWLLIVVLIFVALVGVYHAGIGTFYFQDDFQFLNLSMTQGPFYVFAHGIPWDHMYRPLQALFMSVLYQTSNTQTWPIHIVQFAMHSLFCLLVYLTVLRLGFSRVSALLAAFFMALSAASVSALLGNDTISQVGSGLFGSASLYLLYRALPDDAQAKAGRAPSTGWMVLSLALFFLALMTKETSISYLPMALSILVIYALARRDRAQWRGVVIWGLVFVGVFLGFVALRYAVTPIIPSLGGSKKLDFGFGFNAIQNAGMFYLTAVLPAATSSLFLAVSQRQWAGVIVPVILVVAECLFVAYGLRLFINRRRAILFAVLAYLSVVALFPMILLNHISELYVYNALPFIAMLIGIALGNWVVFAASRPRVVQTVIGLAIALLLILQAAATQTKVGQMRAIGDKSQALTQQLVPLITQLPQNGTLVLLNTSDEREYSVFAIHQFNVFLEGGTEALKLFTRRPDVTIQVADTLASNLPKQACTVVTLDEQGKLMPRAC